MGIKRPGPVVVPGCEEPPLTSHSGVSSETRHVGIQVVLGRVRVVRDVECDTGNMLVGVFVMAR